MTNKQRALWWLRRYDYADDITADNVADLEALIDEVCAEEREACAEAAEDEVLPLGDSYDPRDVASFGTGAAIARRIRERGAK